MKFDMFEAFAREVEARTFSQAGRMDANETAAFTLMFRTVFAKTYDKLYPDVKARGFINVDSRVGPLDEEYTYRSGDYVGEAKLVHLYGPDDFPEVETFSVEFTQKVKTYGDGYGYNLLDLRRSAKLGQSLDATKAFAARTILERKLDKIACIGDSTVGLYGIASDTGTSLPTAAGGGTLGTQAITTDSSTHYWAASAGANVKTTAEALADVQKMRSAIFIKTKGLFEANRYLMDQASYDWANSTTAYPGYSKDTILDVIRGQNPGMQVDWWHQLKTAGANSRARHLMYSDSPDVVQLIIPQEFEQTAPQLQAMRANVYCTVRTGGVEIRYPDAIAYMDGLQAS